MFPPSLSSSPSLSLSNTHLLSLTGIHSLFLIVIVEHTHAHFPVCVCSHTHTHIHTCFYFYLCISVCLYGCTRYMCVRILRGQKRVLHHMTLELPAVVSQWIWPWELNPAPLEKQKWLSSPHSKIFLSM